mmetsp:Transcript_12772/g.23158  ORF Transcript_12772/g.23158 Transcript_12772/m.23158 type:complete len:103 (+) Transcript_12772:122-430(+)
MQTESVVRRWMIAAIYRMSVADNQDSMLRSICSSHRVLLLGTIDCLTIVSHPESGTATTSPLGDVQLCTLEMITVFKVILDHVNSYGDVFASIMSSLPSHEK